MAPRISTGTDTRHHWCRGVDLASHAIEAGSEARPDPLSRSDEEAEPVPARPGVPARTRASVGPASEGLRPMMSSAEAGEGLWRGLTRGPVLVVRLQVVQVTGASVDPAPGEHAVPVAQDDQLTSGCGWVVRVGRVRLHVENWSHGQPGEAGGCPAFGACTTGRGTRRDTGATE